jgi:hypothetical protein
MKLPNTEKEIIEVSQREGAIIPSSNMIATRGLATCNFIVLCNTDSGTTFGCHYDDKTSLDVLKNQVQNLLGAPLQAYVCTPSENSTPQRISKFLEEIGAEICGVVSSKDPMNQIVCFDPETKQFSFEAITHSTNRGPDNYTRAYNFNKSRLNSYQDQDRTISVEYDYRQPRNNGWNCQFGVEKEEECREAIVNFRTTLRNLFQEYGTSAAYRMSEVKMKDIELTPQSKHMGSRGNSNNIDI